MENQLYLIKKKRKISIQRLILL